MATLYELSDAIRQVIDRGFALDEETGEITFDETNLDELRLMFREKAEACALYVKDQRALAKAIRDEERSLAERRRSAERRADRWRDTCSRTSTSCLTGGLRPQGSR